MKGLALCRRYYEEFGRPMLREQFPEVLPHLACGLTGSGSECLGFDDDLSTDHDFEPGFCIFLPGEDLVSRRTEFLLERAYAKLPKEYMGCSRAMIRPVGGARHGVIRMDSFFMEKTGDPEGRLTGRQWLSVPEQSLLEAVNGELYEDPSGKMSRIRENLAYYPEDIRLKKLAGRLLLMAQSGQYNYLRCLGHGEEAGAQMAVFEFVRSTASVIFLLNRRYQPYYKWLFRSLRQLPILPESAELMEYLITTDNEPETAREKSAVIEGLAADVIDELTDQGLTDAICGDLEKHAYSVNDRIADPDLRNLHILSGI